MKLVQLLLTVCVCLRICNGQNAKTHKSFLCDDPGHLEGIRIARTMDFVLCKLRHGDNYCQVCRCEWLRYWDAATA